MPDEHWKVFVTWASGSERHPIAKCDFAHAMEQIFYYKAEHGSLIAKIEMEKVDE